jgi:hypothetical protein
VRLFVRHPSISPYFCALAAGSNPVAPTIFPIAGEPSGRWRKILHMDKKLQATAPGWLSKKIQHFANPTEIR